MNIDKSIAMLGFVCFDAQYIINKYQLKYADNLRQGKNLDNEAEWNQQSQKQQAQV